MESLKRFLQNLLPKNEKKYSYTSTKINNLRINKKT